MDYWKAEEPQQMAQQYMKYHPDLMGAHIAWLFKEKASKSDGRPIVGKPYRVPAKYGPLMEVNSSGEKGYDFIIEIGADVWTELRNDQKEAWVDYLLEQCYGEENESTGEMKWKIRKPEVQAFPVILSRHGTNWDAGVNKLSVIDMNKEPKIQAPEVRNSTTSSADSDVSVNS